MLMSNTELEPLLNARTGGRRRMEADQGSGLGAVATAAGLPVLIDFESSVLTEELVFASAGASAVDRPTLGARRSLLKRLLSPSKKVSRDNADRFVELLRKTETRPRVLVIGAGTVGQGVEELYRANDVQVIGFDLYASPLIHFIADAHDIPLQNGSVDGVVVQAVLEHVLNPAQVVNEIWRVLKPNGLVYSETPFLQHVHEGAYDFTRFTESGHRYLFKNFELLDSGVCGGPGTQLLWSIDYFIRSVFRSRMAGKAAKLAFCWLPLTDRLISSSHGSDAASGFYFLGRRSDQVMKSHDAIQFYRGAQRS